MNEGNRSRTVKGTSIRVAVVLVGIIVGQAVLYGPSLIGRKLLLPVDILALPGVYLPQNSRTEEIVVRNRILSDQVLQFEPNRQWAASEVAAGRVPLWNPLNYCAPPFATRPVWSLPYLFYMLGRARIRWRGFSSSRH